jgi:glycosyltransferase involved in cell wall biosynthesis
MTGNLRIAAIGRLAPVKNLELLARAVAEVPEVELNIIGPTDVREVETNLRTFIASTGLEDRIRLRGPLFGDALQAALEQIDVVAMPSQSESFGNAAIEAAVQGIPVIVSDACGVAPLIHDAGAGLVVPANDERALADAIRRLHDDRALLAQLSSVGPQLRSMVEPKEIASQHVARYERILSGQPPLPGPFSS